MAATDVGTVFIGVEGNVNPLKKSLNQASRDLNSFGARSNRTLAKVDTAFGRLGKSLGGITRAFGKLNPALAGAAGAAGMGLLIKSSLSAADNIGKTADKIGLSTDALQELRFAAGQAGVAQKTLDMGMQRFARRLGEAQRGTGELKDTLIEYGIAVKNVDGSSRATEAVLSDLADALKGAGSDTERLRVAFKAFDSEGVALLNMFKNGSAGLDRMRQSAQEMGIVMEERLIRNAEKTSDKLDILSKVIGVRLKSAILELAPWLASMADSMSRAVIGAAKFFGLIKTADAIRLKEINKEVGRLAEKIERLQKAKLTTAGRIFNFAGLTDKAIADTKAQIAKLEAEADRIVGPDVGAASKTKPAPAPAAAGPDPTIDLKLNDTGTMGSFFAPEEMAKAQAAIESHRQKSLEAIKQIREAHESATMDQVDLIELRKTRAIEALNNLDLSEQELADTIVQINETATKEIVEIYKQRSAGAVAANNKITESERRAKQGALDMAAAVSDGLIDGIKNGEKFSDTLKNILAGVAKIILKMIEARAIDMYASSRNPPSSPGGGGGGGGGGLFDFFKGFGGSSSGGGGGTEAAATFGGGGGAGDLGSGFFAHGGSFKVGGAGGPDTVPVGFMASPGERVTIGDDNGGGATIIQEINISTGVQQTVRNEFIALMPRIKEAAVDAVMDARRRGGSFGEVFGA